MVDRLTKCENAITLDTLDEIALALGVQSWQLLTSDFDPKKPPHIAVTETELNLYKKLQVLVKGTSS